MKKCKWALCVALGIIAMSCIREEPLNAEADIESVTLSGDVLNRAPIIENDKVMLVVKFGTNVTELAPEFKLTPVLPFSRRAERCVTFHRLRSM